MVFKYLFKIYYDFSESRRKNCQTTPCAESRVEAKLDNAADQIIITKNSASRKPRFPSKGKKKDNWARFFLWWNPAKIHTVEKQPCKQIFCVGGEVIYYIIRKLRLPNYTILFVLLDNQTPFHVLSYVIFAHYFGMMSR